MENIKSALSGSRAIPRENSQASLCFKANNIKLGKIYTIRLIMTVVSAVPLR